MKTPNEDRILSHLRSLPGTYQTGREVAAALGLAAGASRPVIEELHALADAGTIEREAHDGLMGSGPKRYRVPT
jgi:hypothetical protein